MARLYRLRAEKAFQVKVDATFDLNDLELYSLELYGLEQNDHRRQLVPVSIEKIGEFFTNQHRLIAYIAAFSIMRIAPSSSNATISVIKLH